MTDKELFGKSARLASEAYEASGKVSEAKNMLSLLREWISTRRDIPDSVASSISRLEEFVEFTRGLSNRIYDPQIKFSHAYRLTEEEYHLLASNGIQWVTAKSLGLSEFDDYEIFDHFCYENDKCYGMINPRESRPEEKVVYPDGSSRQKVGLRIGDPPERVHANDLRPAQREFFEKYLPAIFRRFKSNA